MVVKIICYKLCLSIYVYLCKHINNVNFVFYFSFDAVKIFSVYIPDFPYDTKSVARLIVEVYNGKLIPKY